MNKHLKQFLRLLETKNYVYKHHHIHIMYNFNDLLMTFWGGNVNNDSISGRIDYDCNIKIVLLVKMEVITIECKINDFTESNLNDIYKFMGLTNNED
jgi:hypothetical protein